MASDLRYRLCAYFAVNPDEELTVEDIRIKWGVPERDVHNHLRAVPPAFVRRETRGRTLYFMAGPEI